jgi:cytochrome c oxidase subunit 3
VSLSAAYAALLTGVIVWAVLVRKLRARPWETQLAGDDSGVSSGMRLSAAKVGLWIFLAVITSLFALFMTAYSMRMGHGHGSGEVHDWHSLSEPRVLWLNTGLLILGSIAMQWSRMSAARGDAGRTRDALLMGGLLTCAFLAGQLFAWRELRASAGFTLQDPALAFFYLLTAVHGAHLLGGLVVWAKTWLRMRHKDTELIDIRLSVDLCAVYWHYLLIVWLALFTLLLAT